MNISKNNKDTTKNNYFCSKPHTFIYHLFHKEYKTGNLLLSSHTFLLIVCRSPSFYTFHTTLRNVTTLLLKFTLYTEKNSVK